MTSLKFELSDEMLVEECHVNGDPYSVDRVCFDELLRRYNNKKAALKATESLLSQKGEECERKDRLLEMHRSRFAKLYNEYLETKYLFMEIFEKFKRNYPDFS